MSVLVRSIYLYLSVPHMVYRVDVDVDVDIDVCMYLSTELCTEYEVDITDTHDTPCPSPA